MKNNAKKEDKLYKIRCEIKNINYKIISITEDENNLINNLFIKKIIL